MVSKSAFHFDFVDFYIFTYLNSLAAHAANFAIIELLIFDFYHLYIFGG